MRDPCPFVAPFLSLKKGCFTFEINGATVTIQMLRWGDVFTVCNFNFSTTTACDVVAAPSPCPLIEDGLCVRPHHFRAKMSALGTADFSLHFMSQLFTCCDFSFDVSFTVFPLMWFPRNDFDSATIHLGVGFPHSFPSYLSNTLCSVASDSPSS